MKGKSGKCGSKKGNAKDAGALVWNHQAGNPDASSVASSAPQTETSTTVDTIDTIECTASDLCATTMAQQEVVNPRWTAFNVDTGAEGTVWPMNADYACEKGSGPADRNALWLDGNVGCIIQKESPILTAMRKCFEKACEQHSWKGTIDLTKEGGVYNLYVQVAGGEGHVERAVDVSPREKKVEVERGSPVWEGGLRQVNP